MYDLNWNVIFNNWPAFVEGLLSLALKLAVFGLGIGSVIGLLLAFARTSHIAPLRTFATIYVEIIRNVPLLLLLFLLYFECAHRGHQLRQPERYSAERCPADSSWTAISPRLWRFPSTPGRTCPRFFGLGILAVGKRYLDAGQSLG